MRKVRSFAIRFLFLFPLTSLLCAMLISVDATSNCEKPKLIFGDDINFPPFSYINENGQPAGFNIELAHAIGNAMGYDVEIRLDDFFSIQQALKNGEIDAISGIICSDERKQYLDFSSPQYTLIGDIFMKSGSNLSDIKDLKNQTVVVEKGDFVGQYLSSLDLNIQLVEVPTVEAALFAVREGNYQYAGLAKLSGLYILQNENITDIISQGYTLVPRTCCLAVNKNDDLLLTLNCGLQVLKATGEYDKIYDRWLGVCEEVTFYTLAHKFRFAIGAILLMVLVFIGISVLLNHLVKNKTKELQGANNVLYKNQIELKTLITNMKTLETALWDERNLFKTTLHSLGDGVISTDKDGNVDLMNLAAEDLTGWTNALAKGMAFETVFHIVNEYTGENCPNPVKQVFDTGEPFEPTKHAMLIKKNGDTIFIEDSAAPIKDESGHTIGVVLVFRDFTDKKANQEKIRYLSQHDQLTDLYNRYYFEEQLTLLDVEQNLPFSIAMSDVNGLKLTNDAFGHNVGDAMLEKVAGILKRESRADDIVARVGGDEFVILLPRTARNEAERIVKHMIESIEQEKRDNIIISVSFGLETKEILAQSISEVFTRAEENMYRQKIVETQSMRNQTIKVIMQTLLETNLRERIHSEKVGKISLSIGKVMNLDSHSLKELETAGFMHDIGKIAISESVLNKRGKLTEIEYKEIKRHPEIGYHILKSVDVYTHLADYVLSHHERWDGKGYPRELSGEDIPLIARIIAVADTYEAMTEKRTYRKSVSKKEAILEIKRCSGTQFDPDIVEAFLSTQLV